MERQTISTEKFLIHAHAIWAKQWLLLTAGDFQAGQFNAMTVAWGSFGAMWNKPFAQVVVRPTRHTYGFIEHYDTFTLCVFEDDYRGALNILGTQSGRDGDKIAQAGITPVAASTVAAPAFEEAELVIECRKMYWDDLKPGHFLYPDIDNNYPQKDYHRIYFGEIAAISGCATYLG